jgi:hypothetical protein
MKTLINVAFAAALLIATAACGKKKSKTDAPTASTTSTGRQITGTLSLTAMGLTGAANGVLAFKLSQGRVQGAPAEIAVGADGSFTVPVKDGSTEMAEVDLAIAATTLEDMKTHAKLGVPEYASQIDAITSIDELRSGLADFKVGVSRGRPSYVLVAYEKSGDRLTEAQTFKFIGMPVGSGEQLLNIPASALKGNVSLGVISSGTGDEATATQPADATVFDLSTSTIQEYASLSDSLKVLRNYWMNTNAAGETAAEVTPFFAWRVSDSTAVRDIFTAPTAAPTFTGTGMYLSLHDIGATFDDICALGGVQKSMGLYPPSDVTMTGVGVFNNLTPLSNGGTYTRSSQYSGTACLSGQQGAAYIRNDEPSNGANTELMVNWGSLEGALPSGLWHLKYEGTSKAVFELASSFPLDTNNYPKVYVPVFKLSTASGNLTAVDIKFYIYRDGSFQEVTNAAALENSTNSLGFDLHYNDGSGRSDIHITERDGATFANGVFSYTFKQSEQLPFSGIGYIGFSYLIGSNSFRMEYRP